MQEIVEPPVIQRPAVAIIAAILNFITASGALFVSFLLGLALVFGNMLGMNLEFATEQATRYAPQFDWAPVMNLFLGTFTVTSLLVGIGYLMLGVKLLSGSRGAWYVQVTLSVIGLLFVPVGTILNGLILIFFFQRETRAYFGV